MATWLLSDDAVRELKEVRTMKLQVSTEQLEALHTEGADAGRSRNLRVAGAVAEIRVEGLLTKRPSLLALMLGGGTTYTSIMGALAAARSDPSITGVVLHVDSPGGALDGLFDTVAAIEDFKAHKPITVTASRALSAAYCLAASAGPIAATSAAAEFGSIGIAATFEADDDLVDVTNTDSPHKRPNPRTSEGRAVIVQHLDAVHELFTAAIARGRGKGVTAAQVKSEFGRGAIVLADEAKRRGMIDRVGLKSTTREESGRSAAHANVGPQTAFAREMQEHLGAVSRAPEPPATPDIGDLVVERLRARGWGNKQSASPAQGHEHSEPASQPQPAGSPDIGDEVVARLRARGWRTKQQ